MPSPRLPIIWSPEADEDLIEIWGYLASEASEQVAIINCVASRRRAQCSRRGRIPDGRGTSCSRECDRCRFIPMSFSTEFEITPSKSSEFSMVTAHALFAQA
jgi:plasmid stabilization system protein ParE